MLTRTYAFHEYHSAHKRFTKPMIERFFETELPKNFGPNLRSTIADKLIDIFLSNSVDTQQLKPGQIFWNAVHIETRADAFKVKFVPIVLTMVCQDDIYKLEKGLKISEHRQNVIARITNEAYQQNALLSMRDIALLMASSPSHITKMRQEYERRNNCQLLHTGNLHDMGSTITHKYQIIYKYVVEKKELTKIADETNHSLKAVDHYIKDFNRVKLLYLDDKDPDFIKIATKMPIYVIMQYINIIEQYVKEQK